MFFGVVGIGQAGNNLADEFAKINYPAIAINFSSSDLNSLEHVPNKLTLVGSEGVGKQRSRAMELMENNWESTIEFIKQKFNQPSIEIILVAFSTGGGTGSGISPFIIELLQEQMPDKIICVCPILPDHSEMVGSQINTQEALEDLSQLNICTLPLDNQSVIKMANERVPKNILFKEINSTFVEFISKIDSYTTKNSKNGVVDKRDIAQLFSTKGIMVISETNIADISDFKLDNNHFIDKIQESWKKSIFAPVQYEQIMRAGVIFDGDESLLKYLRYENLFDTFKHSPIELYEGYYSDDKGKVITILSGLDWIYNRVKSIDEIIEKGKERINTVEVSAYKSKNTNKVALFESITKSTTTVIPKKRSVSEMINKYKR